MRFGFGRCLEVTFLFPWAAFLEVWPLGTSSCYSYSVQHATCTGHFKCPPLPGRGPARLLRVYRFPLLPQAPLEQDSNLLQAASRLHLPHLVHGKRPHFLVRADSGREAQGRGDLLPCCLRRLLSAP